MRVICLQVLGWFTRLLTVSWALGDERKLDERKSEERKLDVRVMSFNIRYGTAADGENHWERRQEFLVETMKAFDPDLLGTQETLGLQRDYLAKKLPSRRQFIEAARPRFGWNHRDAADDWVQQRIAELIAGRPNRGTLALLADAERCCQALKWLRRKSEMRVVLLALHEIPLQAELARYLGAELLDLRMLGILPQHVSLRLPPRVLELRRSSSADTSARKADCRIDLGWATQIGNPSGRSRHTRPVGTSDKRARQSRKLIWTLVAI